MADENDNDPIKISGQPQGETADKFGQSEPSSKAIPRTPNEPRVDDGQSRETGGQTTVVGTRDVGTTDIGDGNIADGEGTLADRLAKKDQTPTDDGGSSGLA